MTDRTPAERRVDELAEEARRLRAMDDPVATAPRLRRIYTVELPAAWRAVNQMREGTR